VTQLRRVVAEIRPPDAKLFCACRLSPASRLKPTGPASAKSPSPRPPRLSAFVLTLAYSRALWLEFFFDQTLENFLLGHVHAFTTGWSPRSVTTDNLRSVVLGTPRRRLSLPSPLARTLRSLPLCYPPLPSGARQRKGRVERTIQYVRHSSSPPAPSPPWRDFNRQALAWRGPGAHQRPWPGDDSRTVAQSSRKRNRAYSLFRHPFSSRWCARSQRIKPPGSALTSTIIPCRPRPWAAP